MPENPAEELRAAAATLCSLLAEPHLTPGPWLSLDQGDRIIRDSPHAGAPQYVVDEPMSSGANAAWIAAMHPGVGLALADWLRTAIEEAETIGTDPKALAVARAILGQQPHETGQEAAGEQQTPSGDSRGATPSPEAADGRTAIPPGGNAEDCEQCAGTNPPYPFICPGHDTPDGLRDQYAEAIRDAMPGLVNLRRVGDVLADTVLAVRDRELQQLRHEHDGLEEMYYAAMRDLGRLADAKDAPKDDAETATEPSDAEIAAVLDTVHRVLSIDTTHTPADIGGWLLTACGQLEKSETARRHLRKEREQLRAHLGSALACVRLLRIYADGLDHGRQINAADVTRRIRRILTGLDDSTTHPDAIAHDDPHNVTATVANCIHPEGYDGECPCLTGCGCCKVAVAPHPAATQATDGPEEPPQPTETEQITDAVHTLQTIVNRVREAVTTDEPTWAPPPPGDTREQLPDHLLALLPTRDYLSTACATGHRIETEVYGGHRHYGLQLPDTITLEDLEQHIQRLHKRCRLNHKFTGQLCVCDCHSEQPTGVMAGCRRCRGHRVIPDHTRRNDYGEPVPKPCPDCHTDATKEPRP